MTNMLRTSERNLFKRCQWAWERSYQDRLQYSARESVALWFGTGIHEALEHWYIPGTKRGVDPRETFEEYVNRTAARTEYINTFHEGDFSEAIDAKELGVDMLTQYLEHYGEESHLEVISAEQTFQIPVKHPSWRKSEDAGVVVEDDVTNYVGTFDLVIRDHEANGKIFMWDHKGLRTSEQVMTPEGWKANGDLVVGDLVIGSDGNPTKVTGVYDLGERPVYRVDMSDGSFVDTTDDHFWTLKNYGGRERVLTTEEVMQGSHPSYRYLPSQPEINWEEKELPVEPYVLGVILGDGAISGQGASVSSSDPEVMAKVSSFVPVTNRKSLPGKCQTYGLPGIAKELAGLGLMGRTSHTKFIPEDYLYGSADQRRGLLAGLLDTDGHVDTRKRIKFCTVSDDLKDGIMHLVRSLGGRCSASSSKAYYIKDGEKIVTGRYWHVNIRMKECPFTLKRHVDRFVPATTLSRKVKSVERLEETDQMRCIRVEASDSLYITKDCIVTHNTAKALGSANTQYLPLDDQAGSYWAVANHVLRKQGLISEKEKLAGIIYNYLVKRKADTRPRNPEGFYTNKPQKKHFVSALTEAGVTEVSDKPVDKLKLDELESVADEHGVKVFGEVSANQPPKTFDRVTVYRSPNQQRSQIKRIQNDLEAMSLVRNNLLAATKTPTRECGFCEFREICELDESGRDWTEMADMVYHEWEPYKAHENKEN